MIKGTVVFFVLFFLLFQILPCFVGMAILYWGEQGWYYSRTESKLLENGWGYLFSVGLYPTFTFYLFLALSIFCAARETNGGGEAKKNG